MEIWAVQIVICFEHGCTGGHFENRYGKKCYAGNHGDFFLVII